MTDTRSLITRLEEADRLLRRGELVDARQVYAALLPDAPPEMQAQLRTRMARVEELINPREPSASRAAMEASDQARAEEAFNAGRLEDAIAIYATIVEARPDDQLARERMSELLALRTPFGRERSSAPRIINVNDFNNANAAGTQEAGDLGAALPRLSHVPTPPAAPRPSSPALDVAIALPPAAAAPVAQPLPLDAVELLQELLARVEAHRRPRPGP